MKPATTTAPCTTAFTFLSWAATRRAWCFTAVINVHLLKIAVSKVAAAISSETRAGSSSFLECDENFENPASRIAASRSHVAAWISATLCESTSTANWLPTRTSSQNGSSRSIEPSNHRNRLCDNCVNWTRGSRTFHARRRARPAAPLSACRSRSEHARAQRTAQAHETHTVKMRRSSGQSRGDAEASCWVRESVRSFVLLLLCRAAVETATASEATLRCERTRRRRATDLGRHLKALTTKRASQR